MVLESMLALSACQLSREVFHNPKENDLPRIQDPLQPNYVHENSVYRFYAAAVRKLSRWPNFHSRMESIFFMAAMILFCHLELVMGDFGAFEVHSQGVLRLISTCGVAEIQNEIMGNELLAAWTQTRMHHWWLRHYFSTPDFQIHNFPLSQRCVSVNTSEAVNGGSSRATILSILCELVAMQSSLVARCWQATYVRQDGRSSKVKRQPRLSTSRTDVPTLGPALYAQVSRLLMKKKKLLDVWHKHLAPSEMPLATCDQAVEARDRQIHGRYSSLHFLTHTAATNYAYFVTAQILTSTKLINQLFCKGEDGHNGAVEDEYWTMLLMRVVSPLSWRDCLRLNTHTVGLSSLLLACTLHSNNATVGQWAMSWLDEQQFVQIAEEGSFHVAQIRQALQIINSERLGGRDVLALYQPYEDFGGNGKYGRYTSQEFRSLIVFGKCRTTGLWYSEAQVF